VVIPSLAAEFSAFGAAASELKAAVEQDVAPGDLHDSLDRVNSRFAALEAVARAQLTAAEGSLAGDLRQPPTVTRTVGLRFYRQIHRIDIPVPPGPLDAAVATALVDAFRSRYEQIVGTGTARRQVTVEVVTIGVEVLIPVPLVLPPVRSRRSAEPIGGRPAWFGGETTTCPVYDWDSLGADQEIKGPAFIESAQTTVVVYPGQSTRLDQLGNLRIGFGLA
jgi:N-methylhydantoinase A